MLFFAVRRRSAVDEATGPRNPIGKKGAGGALVAKASSSVLLFHRLRRFGLGSYTYRQHGKRSAPLLNLRQDQTRFWLHTTKSTAIAHALTIGIASD